MQPVLHPHPRGSYAALVASIVALALPAAARAELVVTPPAADAASELVTATAGVAAPADGVGGGSPGGNPAPHRVEAPRVPDRSAGPPPVGGVRRAPGPLAAAPAGVPRPAVTAVSPQAQTVSDPQPDASRPVAAPPERSAPASRGRIARPAVDRQLTALYSNLRRGIHSLTSSMSATLEGVLAPIGTYLGDWQTTITRRLEAALAPFAGGELARVPAAALAAAGTAVTAYGSAHLRRGGRAGAASTPAPAERRAGDPHAGYPSAAGAVAYTATAASEVSAPHLRPPLATQSPSGAFGAWTSALSGVGLGLMLLLILIAPGVWRRLQLLATPYHPLSFVSALERPG